MVPVPPGGVTVDHVRPTVPTLGVALAIVGALREPTAALPVPEPVLVKYAPAITPNPATANATITKTRSFMRFMSEPSRSTSR
jgi:hypothetical protein